MHKTWQTLKKMRSLYKNRVTIETCAFYDGQLGGSGGGVTWDMTMSVKVSEVGPSPPSGERDHRGLFIL